MFIPQAIQSFRSQTYPNLELLILDNGDDETEDLIPAQSNIRYAKVPGKQTTGEMRNLCVRYAEGSIICHFDSDDWSAPERVTDQVTRLGTHNVVTGYTSMLFYDERDGQCYHWATTGSHVRYVLGTSLCYRRDWWRHHPFSPLRVGEDIRFYQNALRAAWRLVPTAPAEKLMVARVHNDQTSRKSLNPASYRPVPKTMLPQGFPCVSTLSAT